MAYHKIDENAVADDEFLSAGILQDLYDQARAAIEARLPRASCSWDFRNHPRLCALERATLPFIVRLPPRVNEVTVRLRGKADGSLGVTLGATIIPLSRLTDPLPADQQTSAVSSSTEATTTLTLDSDDLRGVEEWGVVCLTVTSAEGTPAAIVDSGTANDDGHLDGFRETYLNFAAASTQFGDEIPAAAVEIRDYATSTETVADAAFDPNHPFSRRQVLRADDGDRRLWFWPPLSGQPIARDSTFTRTDVAFWVPLGYYDLYSVEIAVTGIDLPDLGTDLNAGQFPRAMGTLNAIYAAAHQVFSQHGRWHHIGPTPRYETQTDTSDPAKGFWGSSTTPPINPIGAHHTLSGTSWATLQAAVVNSDDEYEAEDESTNKRRTAITAKALMVLSSYGEVYRRNRRTGRWQVQDLGAGVYDLQTRLELVTAGTLAGAVDGDSTTQQGAAVVFDRDSPAQDPLGHLLSFSALNDDQTAYTDDLALHALRGLIPARLWGEVPWVLVTATAVDDNLASAARYAYLQVKNVDTPSPTGPSSANAAARYLHTITWTVVTTPGDDGSAIGKA